MAKDFCAGEVPMFDNSSIWRKHYAAVAAGPNGRVGGEGPIIAACGFNYYYYFSSSATLTPNCVPST